jgi:hypothetical protein
VGYRSGYIDFSKIEAAGGALCRSCREVDPTPRTGQQHDGNSDRGAGAFLDGTVLDHRTDVLRNIQ